MRYIPLLLLLLILASCSTTKKVNKSATSVDSSVVKTRDSLSQRLTELQEKYQKDVTDIRNTGIEFQPDCDTVIIDERCDMDSALRVIAALKNRPPNKVVVRADGSIEAEGRLKNAVASLSLMSTEIASRDQRIEELTRTNDSLAAVKHVEVTTSNKDVKRGFLWFWFLMGGVTGILLSIIVYKLYTHEKR